MDDGVDEAEEELVEEVDEADEPDDEDSEDPLVDVPEVVLDEVPADELEDGLVELLEERESVL